MMRHLSASVVAAVVALLAFAAILSGATPASAAHLSVVSSAIMTDSAQRCTTATLATTAPVAGSSTTVEVVGVPASCVGQQISVYVVGTNGLVLANGSQATATTGTNNVAVGSYATGDVASVAIFFNTWWVDNDWTAPLPVLPATCVPMDAAGNVIAGTCTVDSIVANDIWGSPGAQTANTYVSITSSAPRFRVTFDFSVAPFPGWTPVSVDTGNLEAAPGTTCSTLPVLVLNGPNWSGSPYYLQISEIASARSMCPGP